MVLYVKNEIAGNTENSHFVMPGSPNSNSNFYIGKPAEIHIRLSKVETIISQF